MARLIWLTCGVLVTLAALWTEAGGDKPKAVPVPPLAPPPISLAPKAGADATLTVDKDKLRTLIVMPLTSISLGAEFNPSLPAKEKRGTPQAIAAVKEKLHASPGAAELYVELAELLGGEEQWKPACRKAVELFPKRLESDKNNGWLWARYARALLALKKTSEAAAAALKATELAPNDWRCWQALGKVRHAQWYELIHGTESDRLSRLSQLETINRYLYEEGSCREAEVRLAPTEPQVYWDRANFRCREAISPSTKLQNQITSERGKKAIRAGFDDAKTLARLSPDDIEVHMFLGGYAIIEGCCRVPQKARAGTLALNAFRDLPSFLGLPRENREIIGAAAARLSEVAQKADFSEAARRQLVLFSLILGDFQTAIVHAQEAARLNPKSKENWDLLLGSMMVKSAAKDEKPGARPKAEMRSFADVCERCVQHLPDDQSCLNIAGLLQKMTQYEDAERILRTALKREPHNARLRLGLAAVLLQKSDEPAVLAEGRRCVEQASEELKNSKDDWLRNYVRFLRANHLALTSQLHEAKAIFEDLHKTDPRPRFRNALDAFTQ